MRIFDFHLHPGYDFHNDELGYEITPDIFVRGLQESGVTRCAGSVIHKADTMHAVGDYAEIPPLVLLVFVAIMVLESDYTLLSRIVFFKSGA